MTIMSLKGRPTRRLSGKETKLLLRLMCSEDFTLSEDLEDLGIRLIRGRVAFVGAKIEDRLLVWLATISVTPAHIVQWVYECWLSGESLCTLEWWCRTWPYGIPTDAEFRKAWDSQKLDGANLLDNPNTYRRNLG